MKVPGTDWPATTSRESAPGATSVRVWEGDNRATMHRVRRFDDLTIVRDMCRTTTKSDGPTVAQEAA